MKKLCLLMLLGSFLFTSCYNYKHGRTGWSKANQSKTVKVKAS